MKQVGCKAFVAIAIMACMAASSMAATVTIDGKQFNVCQDASKAGNTDAYGRRWGWENSQSCVVPAGAGYTGCKYTVDKWQKCGGSGGNNQPDEGACCISGYYCARINQWHWQCEAGSGPNSAPVANTVFIDGRNFPVCANPSAAGNADAYGRRWGWENNESCVVPAGTTATPTASPTLSSTLSPTLSPTPTPAPATCKYTVDKWQKCGGSGGNNQPDEGACCISGYYCARINQWHWQCEAGSGTTTTVSGSIQLDGKTIPICTKPSEANVSDKQGRKWGWENNTSCIVVA